MRIVAGRHRGRPLVAPEGLAVRPTGERAREALFDVLASGRHASGQDGGGKDGGGKDGGGKDGGGKGAPPGGTLAGARVLDAFAGSGALGLEALSRGAAQAVFMESHPGALDMLERNVAALGEGARATVLRADVLRPPPAERGPGPCGLALLDPPYNQGLAPPALTALAAAGWLTADALAIVELMAKEPFEPPPGFTLLEERKYGKARLVFLRRQAGRGTGGATVGR